MSTSREAASNLLVLPVADFKYRQMMPTTQIAEPTSPIPIYSADEPQEFDDQLLSRLAVERAIGAAEAEARLRQEFEVQRIMEEARISTAVSNFETSRREYFIKVELEVVQLALAIAGKILHRESQVDPMLLAALVQIALSQLRDGSIASLRVRPEESIRWRKHFSSLALKIAVAIEEDGNLLPGDCILQTELGAVNFNLDLQLKEVQQGFFDLLAQKPQL